MPPPQPHHNLLLRADHGDVTLAQQRYAFTTKLETGNIMPYQSDGLPVKLGEAEFSTDLSGVLGGSVVGQSVILRRPETLRLVVPATADIALDRSARTVTGDVAAYMRSRGHLALWPTEQTDRPGAAAKEPAVIEPANVVGSFRASPSLQVMLSQMAVQIASWQAIDYARMTQSLLEFFTPAATAQWGAPAEIMHELMEASVEAGVMAGLRQLRLEGLVIIGYTVPAPINTPAALALGRTGQQRRLQAYELALKNQFFSGHLLWLQHYAATELRIMALELDETT